MGIKLFQKVCIGVAALLTIFYAYWLGVDVQAGNTKEAIADGILLAFWLFASVFFGIMAALDNKLDRELEESRRELDRALYDFLGTVNKDAHESIARKKQFIAIFNEVTGTDFFEAKTVSARHKSEIQKRFHEKTGLYATINVKPGEIIGIVLSSEKPTAKKTVTTKKGK